MALDEYGRVTLSNGWISPVVKGTDPLWWYYSSPDRHGHSFMLVWADATDPFGDPVPPPNGGLNPGWVTVRGTSLSLYWQPAVPAEWDPEGNWVGGWTLITGAPRYWWVHLPSLVVVNNAISIGYQILGFHDYLSSNQIGSAGVGNVAAGWETGESWVETGYSAPQFAEMFKFAMHYQIEMAQGAWPDAFVGTGNLDGSLGPVNLGGSLQVATSLELFQPGGALRVKLNAGAGDELDRYATITGGPDANDTGLLRVKTTSGWHTADDRAPSGQGILWVKTGFDTGMDMWSWGSWVEPTGGTGETSWRIVELTPTWEDRWPLNPGVRFATIPRDPEEFVQPPDYAAYSTSPEPIGGLFGPGSLADPNDGAYLAFPSSSPTPENRPPDPPFTMYYEPSAWLSFPPPAEPVEAGSVIMGMDMLLRIRGWPLSPWTDQPRFILLPGWVYAVDLPHTAWLEPLPPDWQAFEGGGRIADARLMGRVRTEAEDVFAQPGQWVTMRKFKRTGGAWPSVDDVNRGAIRMQIDGPSSQTAHVGGVKLRLYYRSGDG